MRNRTLEVIVVVVLVIVVPEILCNIILDNNAALRNDLQSSADSILETVSNGTESLPELLDDSKYITVLDSDGSVCLMDIDTYLTAVVLCEMPAEFEFEALKAQAVVARTYALKKASSGGKHDGAALCMNASCCQGFYEPDTFLKDGGNPELLERVRRAVKETKDLVLFYEGALIDATYFSCSGGRTEDALSVWGSDIPYLQSIDSPGEEAAIHYTDTVSFTKYEIANVLNIDPETMAGNWIKDITYTDGGGVDTLEICGKTYTGTQLRKLLGLRSTAFVITPVGQSVMITTKGFGHRVGMSQYGAEAMAVNGSNYQEILTYYYQGVSLKSYSG